jgi:hypothetical protein
MKIAGFLLLFAGWFLALAAVVLLRSGPAQNAFVLAGIAVEILGLILAARSHVVFRSDRG